MGLFSPAWKSNNEKKALNAVDKMTNQSELVDVALYAYQANIRSLAVKKISDNLLLLRLIHESKEKECKETAVNQISDQLILVDVFHLFSDTMQKKILTRITDSTALHKLIKLDSYSHHNIHEIINKITDSDILFELALEKDSLRVKMLSYRRLPFYDVEFDDKLFGIFTPQSPFMSIHRLARFVKDELINPEDFPSNDLETRREVALDLAEIMKRDEKLANIFWEIVKSEAECEHLPSPTEVEDIIKDEYGTRGSRYTVTADLGGLGIEFPANPFLFKSC